ncbi:peptidase inhibitor family I36 protein [Lentzea albidocapillata]|uniref:Peptidase inhibitor family I36 n=1 Tax=Lentzea albidocapillata TaxID=40571 RepID=A0A1W2FJP7_9PSEU|nr:peptidase inhibitor family I36 protein [Lentzea albidocapillata]SMD22013.1 Peptidase inhibitor family I36 [Lentzea albidocapillata]
MFRNVARVTGVVTLVAALGLSLSAVSPAVAGPEQCPEGHFCLWEHAGYKGRFFSSPHDVPNVGPDMNDKSTSHWNRMDKRVCVYDHSRYRGLLGSYGSNSFGHMDFTHDIITSFRRVNAEGRC